MRRHREALEIYRYLPDEVWKGSVNRKVLQSGTTASTIRSRDILGSGLQVPSLPASLARAVIIHRHSSDLNSVELMF